MTSRRPEVSISYRFCPLCGDSLDEAPCELLPREDRRGTPLPRRCFVISLPQDLPWMTPGEEMSL